MPDPPPSPTLPRLFLGFLSVGICGFGGVLPWARRMVVEQKRWLTAAEFTDMLGLCQFLPGESGGGGNVCRDRRAAAAVATRAACHGGDIDPAGAAVLRVSAMPTLGATGLLTWLGGRANRVRSTLAALGLASERGSRGNPPGVVTPAKRSPGRVGYQQAVRVAGC
jgi:Chromate transporter